MSELDVRLLPVFVRQHGLVSQADVLAAGGTQRHIATRLGTGVWERVQHGVYRLVGLPETWHSKVLAPILSFGTGAVASYFTAGALHGWPGFGRGTPDVSIPRGGKLRRDDARVHTSTDLVRCRTVVIDHIPVTEPARTILDVGGRVSDARLRRIIEDARRSEQVDWDGLTRTLARHARRGRSGTRRLRRVLLAHAHRSGITDSNFELLVLSAILDAGLPEPVMHHEVHDGERFVAEVDFAYPQWKIALEVDGPHHLDPDVRRQDLTKQNDLQLLGWLVLRFTWDRFRASPERCIAEIAAAIRAAPARPPTLPQP